MLPSAASGMQGPEPDSRKCGVLLCQRKLETPPVAHEISQTHSYEIVNLAEAGATDDGVHQEGRETPERRGKMRGKL